MVRGLWRVLLVVISTQPSSLKELGQTEEPRLYSTTIPTPPGEQNWLRVRKWCQLQCQSPYRYEGEGAFTFAGERDYTLFLLTWQQ